MKKKFVFKPGRRVRLPNGRTATIDYIEHPGAVVIAPFLAEDKVVFLRQFRPALKKYLYELPAGTIDPGESLSACARRELIEETGLRCRKVTKLGQIYPVPGYSTEVLHLYKAEGLVQGRAAPEDYEVLESVPMGRSQVRSLFKSGKLQDAKSICALAYCGWL